MSAMSALASIVIRPAPGERATKQTTSLGRRRVVRAGRSRGGRALRVFPRAPGGLEETALGGPPLVEDLGRLCVYLATRDCYATNAIFHVDGGIDSNNSPLPIPDY